MNSLRLLLLVILLVPSTTLAAETCASDTALAREGWSIHGSKDFSKYEAQVRREMKRAAEDFVLDMSTRILSRASNRAVEITSYDRLSTPQSVMYGDVVLVVDILTGKLSELRWFDGTRKHVAYSSDFQTCAMGLIPYSVNTLL